MRNEQNRHWTEAMQRNKHLGLLHAANAIARNGALR